MVESRYGDVSGDFLRRLENARKSLEGSNAVDLGRIDLGFIEGYVTALREDFNVIGDKHDGYSIRNKTSGELVGFIDRLPGYCSMRVEGEFRDVLGRILRLYISGEAERVMKEKHGKRQS